MSVNDQIHPAQQAGALMQAIALIRKIGGNEYTDGRNRKAVETAKEIIALIDTQCADRMIVRQSWSI